MCVIMATRDKVISEDWVAKGFEANPHGAGIAWRQDGYVHWKKGLDLDEIQEMAAKTAPPYILHFRVQTVGGVRADLTHPFIVDHKSPLALEGRTKGAVLFHNGHWNSWKADSKEAALKIKGGLPVGKWSDSRALAFMASVYGPGILEFIDEKVMLFSPTKVEVFGNPWTLLDGIWVSNTHWQSKSGNSWRGRFDGNNKGKDADADTVRSAYNGESQSVDNKDRRALPLATTEERVGASGRVTVMGPARHISPAANNGQGTAAEEAAGGQSAESPFDRANRRLKEAMVLFSQKARDGKGQPLISKNELKRRQRDVDIEARRMNRAPKQSATRH